MAVLLLFSMMGTFSLFSVSCGGDSETTYSVVSTVVSGGTISASAEKVKVGDPVTFVLTAQSGYGLKSFTINGGEVEPYVREQTDEGTVYEYTVRNALSDYTAVADFAPTNIVISFAGDDIGDIANINAVYGGVYGKLPTPVCSGKKFIGWADRNGKIVNQSTKIVDFGDITLTAVWEEISQATKDALKPFSATTAYFDAAAKSYGVVWHTSTKPITPVVQYVKGNVADFTDATTVDGSAEEWIYGEYIISAVIDGLEFSQQYTVRFGDESADVWSSSYTFTTRKEQIDVAKFFYITDTQEYRKIENRADSVKLAVDDTYWAQTMRDAVTRFPDADFIAHGGDMVNYGAATWAWREMLGSVEEYLFNLPIQMTAGNHEDPSYNSAGYETVSKIFHVDAPQDNNRRGDYYSFDYGPMHFIVLCSNDVFEDNKGVLRDKQIAWLRQDMEKARADSDIKWVVVMMHEGPIVPSYTKPTSNYHQSTLGKQMIPVFDELNVDLVLYGHNHYLETTYPLIWDESATPLLNDGLKVKRVTTTTAKETYNGDEVDVFVYPEGTVKRGTVYHETGTAGHGYNSTYKLSDLQTNLTKLVNYRILLSGEKNCFDEVQRSMYSYIEVTNNSLVVRTYGVDVKGLSAVNGNTGLTDYGVYMDGFMLRK